MDNGLWKKSSRRKVDWKLLNWDLTTIQVVKFSWIGIRYRVLVLQFQLIAFSLPLERKAQGTTSPEHVSISIDRDRLATLG